MTTPQPHAPARRALTTAGLLFLAACAPRIAPAPAAADASAPIRCERPAAPAVRSTLYFGMTRAHGGVVTPGEWEAFLAREITPVVGGLTVLAARGQWLGSDGPLVREETRVVVILHADAEGPRQAIAGVIRRYRERFDQESVLWETTPACVTY